MDHKKARERYFLNEVAEIYPGFPEGEINNSESPDFIIKQDNKIIGIELVDYVRGQNEGESLKRRNEILHENLIKKAREKFESKHHIPLMIRIIWKENHSFHQSEITELAKDVVSLVEKNIPLQLFEQIDIEWDELYGTSLENICDSIIVIRVRNENQWSDIPSDWTEIQIDEIQQLINAKNDKVQDYLQHCETVRLIIVADGNYMSSNIDLTDEVTNNIFKSPFEQVIIYDRSSRRVVPLKLQIA